MAHLRGVAAGHGEGVKGGVGQTGTAGTADLAVENLEIERIAVVRDENIGTDEGPKFGIDFSKAGRIRDLCGRDAVGLLRSRSNRSAGAYQGVETVDLPAPAHPHSADFDNLGPVYVEIRGFNVEGGIVGQIVAQVGTGERLTEFERSERRSDFSLPEDVPNMDETPGWGGRFRIKEEDQGVRLEGKPASGEGLADGQPWTRERTLEGLGEDVAEDFVPTGDKDPSAVFVQREQAVYGIGKSGQFEGVLNPVQVVLERGQGRSIELVEDVVNEVGQGDTGLLLRGVGDHAGEPEGAFDFETFSLGGLFGILKGGLFEAVQVVPLLQRPNRGVQGRVGDVEFPAEEVFEAGVVTAVQSVAEDGEGAVEGGLVEETPRLRHLAGDALVHEDFFEFGAQGVLRIKNGGLGVGEAGGFIDAAGNIGHDEPAFVPERVEGDSAHEGALFPGVEIPFVEDLVIGDEGAGEADDRFGGAVIFFQYDRVDTPDELLPETLDIFRVGVSPAVDGLFVVGHDKEAAVGAGEHAHNLILFAVGVLEFVHQNMPEAIPAGLQNVIVVPQEVTRDGDEVVEVDQAVAAQFGLVGLEEPAVSRGDGTVGVVAALPLEARQIVEGVGEVGLFQVQARHGAVEEGALEVGIGDAEVGGRPAVSQYSRRMPMQKRWKVPAVISATRVSPGERRSRATISPAALLVKVRARMCCGGTPRTSTRWRTRSVSTRVFPVPGPARMRRGPTGAVTASFWAGLSAGVSGTVWRRSGVISMPLWKAGCAERYNNTIFARKLLQNSCV